MKSNHRNNRTYLIISLCLILLLMAVGFAAFSSQLTINGTSNISSNWCVGFDSSAGSVTPTKGPKTASNPTGSANYSGVTCDSGYKTDVTLLANLYQPGDSVEYILSVKNDSSLNAKIDSIIVDNESVTANNTITKGNILFVVEMPEKTSLTAGESTTMKITVRFQNLTDIGKYSGESQSVNVKINASQDNGNGGMALDTTSFGGQTVTLSSTGDGLYYDSNTNEYYYKGANPNNYIEFNGEVWRIMSINSTGNIKIIKDERINLTGYSGKNGSNNVNGRFDASGSTGRRTTGYCSKGNGPTYGCNAWAAMSNFVNGSYSGEVTEDAELNTYLNSTYKNSLTDLSYVQTGMTWNTGPAGTGNDTNSVSTLQGMEDDYTWIGDIALPTKSEYIRANGKDSCLTASALYSAVNTNTCRTSNYLWKSGYWYWLLSPFSGYVSFEFFANNTGLVNYNNANNTAGSVRPVLHLKSNIQLSGNGGQNSSAMYKIVS